jgi:hypothetical protein
MPFPGSAASGRRHRRSGRGGAGRGPLGRWPASPRRSALRECRRRGRAGRGGNFGRLAADVDTGARQADDEVGLSAILTVMSWPLEMPPSMPPALLPRNPCGRQFRSRCSVPSCSIAFEARADLDALDSVDAHHGTRRYRRRADRKPARPNPASRSLATTLMRAPMELPFLAQGIHDRPQVRRSLPDRGRRRHFPPTSSQDLTGTTVIGPSCAR